MWTEKDQLLLEQGFLMKSDGTLIAWVPPLEKRTTIRNREINKIINKMSHLKIDEIKKIDYK